MTLDLVEVDRTQRFRVPHRRDLVRRLVDQQRVARDARGMNDAVDSAEALQRRFDRGAQLGQVRDVGL